MKTYKFSCKCGVKHHLAADGDTVVVATFHELEAVVAPAPATSPALSTLLKAMQATPTASAPPSAPSPALVRSMRANGPLKTPEEPSAIAAPLASERLCQHCDRLFRTSAACGSHKRFCPKRPGRKRKPFPCPKCKEVFQTLAGLDSHRRARHS